MKTAAADYDTARSAPGPSEVVRDYRTGERTMNKKFDRRFPGPTNASLRAMIRDVVACYTAEVRGLAPRSKRSLPDRIEAIGGYFALSAAGLATLKLVADDYAAAAKVKP